MKETYKNMAIAALALSAVACSQDEDFTSAYLCDPDAVRITAQVGNTSGGFTRSNPIGTEDEQKTFNSGDKIGVSAGSQAAVVYTLDADGKTWNPETDKYLKWESNPMNFTAWYPATDNTDDKNFTPSYNNTVSSLAELQANDYMTYSGEQNNTNGNSVNLTMKRQMVRVVIDGITYGNQYNENDNAVEAIAITAGSNKYENGTWTGGSVTARMYHNDGDNGDGKWYAVVPPTVANLSITLKTGETHTVKNVTATTAGNSYSFNLSVGKNIAKIANVSVETWGNDIIPGGEAEEYIIKYTCTKNSENGVYFIEIDPTDETNSKPVAEIEEGVMDIIVTNALSNKQQIELAKALGSKVSVAKAAQKITLYLPKVTKENLAPALSDCSDISVICGITEPSKAAKGDCALLNGTFIHAEDLAKLTDAMRTVIEPCGIVFWTTTDSNKNGQTPAKLTDDKIMNTDFPDCTHGLIMSLTYVSTGCRWQGTGAEVEGNNQKYYESVYNVFQNTSDTYSPSKSTYVAIESGLDANDNINRILGYNNTKVLKAYNEYCSNNSKGDYIVKAVDELVNWAKTHPKPKGATDWFLPSVKELILLRRGDVDDVWNQTDKSNSTPNMFDSLLSSVKGDTFGSCYHWTSTERATKPTHAFIVQFGHSNCMNTQSRDSKRWVRAVCAF